MKMKYQWPMAIFNSKPLVYQRLSHFMTRGWNCNGMAILPARALCMRHGWEFEWMSEEHMVVGNGGD